MSEPKDPTQQEGTLVPLEVQSLNVDDLDIEELERRLELTIVDGDTSDAGCYMYAGCGSNCQTNNCGTYSGLLDGLLY